MAGKPACSLPKCPPRQAPLVFGTGSEDLGPPRAAPLALGKGEDAILTRSGSVFGVGRGFVFVEGPTFGAIGDFDCLPQVWMPVLPMPMTNKVYADGQGPS